jgi:hypothetical protein
VPETVAPFEGVTTVDVGGLSMVTVTGEIVTVVLSGKVATALRPL